MNDDAFAKSGTSATNAADDLLAALAEKGVEYVFANSGTDFPSLIESWDGEPTVWGKAVKQRLAQRS